MAPRPRRILTNIQCLTILFTLRVKLLDTYKQSEKKVSLEFETTFGITLNKTV